MSYADFAEGRRMPKKEKREAVEAVCPKCRRTEIVYLPDEDVPMCPRCRVRMVIRELLNEGKSY